MQAKRKGKAKSEWTRIKRKKDVQRRCAKGGAMTKAAKKNIK